MIDDNGRAVVNGPLRACEGPYDYEGEGRERYWDMSDSQRLEVAGAMLRGTGPESDRQFAKGWLSERSRHVSYLKSIAA